MRKFHARPYSPSVRPSRLISLILGVAVLWMLYGRFKDPATWRNLLDLKDDPVATAQPQVAPATPEVVVAGPNDLDPVEALRLEEMLALISDKSPLKPREMHAYWKLMSWCRTASSAEMEQRALHDVPFTRLWEQPEKYRGKLISLRLHVRRVLKYDAPSNPQELKDVYEAWGWTDESRSFPYVIVFPERPEGLPEGTDIRGEVTFVGYFLKVMSYTAFDTPRGAPLLVGRVQSVQAFAAPPPPKVDPSIILGVLVVGVIVAGLGVLWQARFRRPASRLASLPDRPLLPDNFSLEVSDPAASVDKPADSPERNGRIPPILQS